MSLAFFLLTLLQKRIHDLTKPPSECLAWKGLAPPTAEILVWFILQGRLNTKERLGRLNIIPMDRTVSILQ